MRPSPYALQAISAGRQVALSPSVDTSDLAADSFVVNPGLRGAQWRINPPPPVPLPELTEEEVAAYRRKRAKMAGILGILGGLSSVPPR